MCLIGKPVVNKWSQQCEGEILSDPDAHSKRSFTVAMGLQLGMCFEGTIYIYI